MFIVCMFLTVHNRGGLELRKCPPSTVIGPIQDEELPFQTKWKELKTLSKYTCSLLFTMIWVFSGFHQQEWTGRKLLPLAICLPPPIKTASRKHYFLVAQRVHLLWVVHKGSKSSQISSQRREWDVFRNGLWHAPCSIRRHPLCVSFLLCQKFLYTCRWSWNTDRVMLDLIHSSGQDFVSTNPSFVCISLLAIYVYNEHFPQGKENH